MFFQLQIRPKRRNGRLNFCSFLRGRQFAALERPRERHRCCAAVKKPEEAILHFCECCAAAVALARALVCCKLPTAQKIRKVQTLISQILF